jgi:MoxR-like ATPase
MGYPSAEREVEIVMVRAPEASESLARKVVAAVGRLRQLDLVKPPGVAETLDWVAALRVLGQDDLDASTVEETLGAVIKERDDLETVLDHIEELVADG